MSACITADAVAKRIAPVLRREIHERRYAARKLADLVGVTPRSIENWASETTAPRAAELLRLMASNDEIAAEIHKLVQEAKHCSRS